MSRYAIYPSDASCMYLVESLQKKLCQHCDLAHDHSTWLVQVFKSTSEVPGLISPGIFWLKAQLSRKRADTWQCFLKVRSSLGVMTIIYRGYGRKKDGAGCVAPSLYIPCVVCCRTAEISSLPHHLHPASTSHLNLLAVCFVCHHSIAREAHKLLS